MFHSSLSTCALQIFRLCVWLVLLSVVFAPLERLFALHPKKFFRKEVAVDLTYYFLNNLVPSVLMSVPLALVAWAAHHFVPSAFTAQVASLPLAIRVAAALIVGEIGFYWGHRWSHELPILWRFHAVHHSAEEMDFLVSARAHPVDIVFTRLCGMVPLYILGLASPLGRTGSLMPLLLVLMSTFWGFFIHANVKWRFGLAESVVSTPAFHHWHHTNDGAVYINKNYAPLLPFIDRLFGTFFLPRHAPERFGIDEAMPATVLGQLRQPFQKDLRPKSSTPAADARMTPEPTPSTSADCEPFAAAPGSC
jgi:sterol desaturase/sphingolipid hydroxylase (fatty acid hydroxylase superfamily)